MSKKWVEYWKVLGKDLKKVFYLYPKLKVLHWVWNLLNRITRALNAWADNVALDINTTTLELEKVEGCLEQRTPIKGLEDFQGFKDTPGPQGTKGPSGWRCPKGEKGDLGPTSETDKDK